MNGPDRRPRRAPWFRYAQASTVGIEMGLSVAVGVFGGLWLERNVTGVAPWTSLAGLAIGLGAAILAVVRAAGRVRREHREPTADEGADHGGS
ncbi:MAG: AtpZ/AtpI family protein [Deltaproteobacteria bacterium]|nr:MAG: AtpZ/AtpI family protein [Deltaproteobacteria bacterium]